MNVEWCNKAYLVKYLFRYITQGYDCANMALRGSTVSASNGHQDKVGGIDEIEQYIRSRYLSSCEADWRIFGFDIHGRTPAVASD